MLLIPPPLECLSSFVGLKLSELSWSKLVSKIVWLKGCLVGKAVDCTDWDVGATDGDIDCTGKEIDCISGDVGCTDGDVGATGEDIGCTGGDVGCTGGGIGYILE